MLLRRKNAVSLAVAVCAALCIGMGLGAYGASVWQATGLLRSMVVSWDQASKHEGDWGEMRRYFFGETYATKNVLVAAAVVKPGKAVHRSHRHAEEEYLILVSGEGMWQLGEKQFPAKQGDILYVEPWVYHGLTNTGSKPLIFAVVRYNPKGVEIPQRPDNQPDEL